MPDRNRNKAMGLAFPAWLVPEITTVFGLYWRRADWLINSWRGLISMRIQEIHPAIAHFPIALFPTAVLADVFGRALNDQQMMEMGRRLMPIAVATMAATGIAGLAAQGAVRTDEQSEKMLITHRTLNISSLVLGMALAFMRLRQDKPNAAYLMAGLAMSALLTYSGYLGGRMVYEHGVGVRPANGLQRGRSPQFPGYGVGRTARLAAADAGAAIAGTARDTAHGRLAPLFQATSGSRSGQGRKSRSGPKRAKR
jgi:uncharacterized membrane protein